MKQQWIADVTSSVKDAKNVNAAQKANTINEWFQNLHPEVFPRHLHSLIGASWKDAGGVHFDEWLD